MRPHARYPRVPPVDRAVLRERIADAHEHTLSVLAGIEGAVAGGPAPECDPPLWTLGHTAWLQQSCALTEPSPAAVEGVDRLFDPAVTKRRARWETTLPARKKLFAWKTDIRDRLLDRAAGNGAASVEDSYFLQLAVQIEDMQSEAILRARQLLALPAPAFGPPCDIPEGDGSTGDVSVPSGVHMLGASTKDPFYMDNEKWGHGYEAGAFSIARTPVTNAQFIAFIEDGGYGREDLWSRPGWGWRNHVGADRPRFWQKQDGVWAARSFDRVAPLGPNAPVMHVTWYEAEAWCAWAGRRLPWEAEWEIAAQRAPSPEHEKLHGPMRRYPWGDDLPSPSQANLDARLGGPVSVHGFPAGDSGYGCRQMAGNVWEWTGSAFQPYENFVPDAWVDYSRPFFDGRHAVLRGGSWATRGRAVWNTFRGFHPLDSAAAFAGFRTCARDE